MIIGDMIANKYPIECRQCLLYIYTKDALSDEKRKSTDTLSDAYWIRRDCLFSCFYWNLELWLENYFLRPFLINIYIFPKIRFSWHLSKRTAQSGLFSWLRRNLFDFQLWELKSVKNMHFISPPKNTVMCICHEFL